MNVATQSDRGRARVFSLLALLFVAMRAFAHLNYRFDSDEGQHLHVAWTWTAGLLPYRDQFDNHAPLFGWLMSHLLASFGERADILYWMRLPMIATTLLVLGSTWFIARRTFDATLAGMAVALTAFYPTFFLRSVEFRTDNLWLAFWMLAVATLVSSMRASVRFPAAGLLLSLAFATSMKTTLLCVTLLLSGVLLLVWSAGHSIRTTTMRIASMALFVPIVPALILFWFAREGALPELRYCVVEFNALVTTNRPHALLLRALFAAALITAVAFLWRTRRPRDERQQRAFFVIALPSVYLTTLLCIWPVVTDRDQLAAIPLAMFSIALLLRSTLRTRARAVLAGILSLFVLATAAQGKLWRKQTGEAIETIAQALQITRTGDLLLDYKGETIYRRRPFFYALEFITRRAMREGKLQNTIVRDVVEKRCYVTQSAGPFFTEGVVEVLHRYFVDVGRLRVAGQSVIDGRFEVLVPGTYAVIVRQGSVQGLLDGTRYDVPRTLSAGVHTFAGSDEAIVLWAPAVERGARPASWSRQ